VLYQISQATKINIEDSLEILCTKNYWYWPIFFAVIWKYNRATGFSDKV